MQNNRLWWPTHLLQSTWCPKMTDALSVERQSTLVTIALRYSVTTVMVSAILPMIALTKSLHWGHLSTITGHIPSHVTTTTIETDNSPLTTDTMMKDALTSHDHNTNPTMTETLATTKDMYPTPHPTTTVVHSVPQLTGTLGNTHIGTHHTGITMPHVDHTTFHTRVILEFIPQTKADLVQATVIILLEDHTQGQWQNHTWEQQTLINPTNRRRSSFKIHNQTKDSTEWRQKSLTNCHNIGLVMDCPTVTAMLENEIRH